jgi:peptidoglycan/LPS O-acetylase OafA/YrhL
MIGTSAKHLVRSRNSALRPHAATAASSDVLPVPTPKFAQHPVHHSIIGLNLLRATAALLVFLGHVRGSCFVEFGALPHPQQGLLAKMLFGLTRTGHEAVLVFFVLSGYLVGGQVIRRVSSGTFNIAAYGLDRATRIFIPLIPACIFTVILTRLVTGQTPNSLQLLLNMLGLNGVLTDTLSLNAPLWTLSYEIWFYILAGAVGVLFSVRKKAVIAFFIIASSVAVFCVLEARYALFWSMGAVSISILGFRTPRFFALFGLLIFSCGILDYQLAAESKSFINVVYLPIPVAEALIVLGVCLSIPYFCDPTTDSSLRFLQRPAVYLSSISYTLYLFHYPLNSALGFFPKFENLSWLAIGMFCTKAALIFLFVNILYLAFEANTLTVRHYVRKRFMAR